jgi:hypothetical protein
MLIKSFSIATLVLLSSVALLPKLAQANSVSAIVAQQSGASSNRTQAPYINRFTAQSVQQLQPGTELSFTLVGTPGATASFSIEGVAFDQPMQEVSPGTYQGRYVIRRQDYFPAAGANVIASLKSGEQLVRAQLDQPLVANSAGSSATPSPSPTPSTAQLPLEITSPQNNSRVSGSVEVKGRSAPNTRLNVSVQAVNSLAGLVGINRNILNQSIQTDAQGNFSFTFQPTINVSGTRYEVSLNATSGDQTKEEKLVLFQQ